MDVWQDLEQWLGARGRAATGPGWRLVRSVPAPTPPSPSSRTASAAALAELVERMRDNYPFGHPRYAGQMVKPPHPAAIVGYLAAMQVQPQQPRPGRRTGHRADGEGGRRPSSRRCSASPTTSATSPRPGRWPTSRRCSSPARRTRTAASPTAPTRTTRTRGCATCWASRGSRGAHRRRRPDGPGRPRRPAASAARSARSSLTAGTTGLGAVDRVDLALALCREHGVRVHVDAAYGGFFRLLADDSARRGGRRRRGWRSRTPTPWSSTRTSTGCSRTAAVPCSSATRRSGGSTSTTRRTRTSPRTSCTWARSRWSAAGPVRRRPRCG